MSPLLRCGGEGSFIIPAHALQARSKSGPTEGGNQQPGNQERQQQGRGIIYDRDEIITDFQGQAIRLPYERWLHIIDPAGQHPYMIGMRAELVQTLQEPEVVIRSKDDPEWSRIYFRWFENTEEGAKWIRAVVKFLDDGDAFVLTAFVRERLDSGEVLWRK